MLEHNLTLIAQNNPSLAESILKHSVQKAFQFDQAQSQDYILIYDNEPYHSIEDPQKEALSTFENIADTTEKGIIIIFGLGLGYLFKRVCISSKSRIILYEPNLDILRITFETVDFTSELSETDRIIVINKMEDFMPAFTKFYLREDPVNICFSSGYKQRYASSLDSFLYELGVIKGTLDNNYFTMFSHYKGWLENCLKNIQGIKNSIYVDCLKNKFLQSPAFIVSPGPSLNNNIAQLSAAQTRGVVFCTGGALRLAQQHKLKPDFATFIDASELTSYQIDGIETNPLNFILQPYTYPNFYEVPSARKFVYLPENDIFSSWLAKILNIKVDNIKNYGTVSMSCVLMAIHMGCNPIIILGQDLALSKEGSSYADASIKLKYKQENLTVEGHNGEKLPSNSTFISFKGYFEEIAKKYKHSIRFINASESGAIIKYFEHIPLAKALKEIPEDNIDIEKTLSEAQSAYINPLQSGRLKVNQALNNTLKALESLKEYINRTKSIINKINKELLKKNININYLAKIQQQQLSLNNKIDRLLQGDAQLILPFVQKEAFDFQQGIGRYKRFDTPENIKKYNDLLSNYYDAIIQNMPQLKSYIEKALRR